MTPWTGRLVVRGTWTAFALAATLCFGGGPLATESDPSSEVSSLVRVNASLRAQVELASGEAFYLLLDPSGPTLELMLEGVVLQTCPVSSVEIGTPRVLFAASGPPEGWRERVWTRGALRPDREQERVEIRADGTGAEPEEIPIPPTPEEMYPAPDRWRIRYEEGLSLEIVVADPPGEDGSFRPWNALASRAEGFAAALSDFGTGSPRVRVALDRRVAASLYRSLPPDTSLLILPGESGP